MGEVWITSDPHFYHTKPFLYKPRGFDNVYDMNDAIQENWNKIVAPEDTVYLLGDVILNDIESGLKLLKSLKGKIHIIIGNHDSDEKIKLYADCHNVYEIGFAKRLKLNKYKFFLTHYPTLCANMDDGKELKKHTINLCGHRHTTNPYEDLGKGLIFHCELDAHGLKPVNIEDIRDRLKFVYDII